VHFNKSSGLAPELYRNSPGRFAARFAKLIHRRQNSLDPCRHHIINFPSFQFRKNRSCRQREKHLTGCFPIQTRSQTISAYDARTGFKQLQVRGLEAVRFCAILKATGVNIFRAAIVRKAFMEAPEAFGRENPGLGHAIFIFKERCATPLGRLQPFMALMGTYKIFQPIFAR
jgi:hypothetical protein